MQRLPVRIALDRRELEAHPLAIGLSMEVEVDVRKQDGERLAQASATDWSYRTAVFTDKDRSVEALIASIVERNGGGRAAPTSNALHASGAASGMPIAASAAGSAASNSRSR